MSEKSVNNKQIAKNTFFLYLRMIVVMGIGLYTVRAILSLLGVVDYGIYNVVGGVVAMFSFVNSTLTTASQRYFSIELAKGDLKKLNEWFCLNITAFSLFIILFLVIAETVGLWFVNTQLTIPSERLYAANIVYQFSILSFCFSFISVPYNALIIAHERMSAFAYISIIEALLKLGIVFVLSIITWDKLIVYGLLTLISTCGITLSYIFYDLKHFSESKFRLYWNKDELKELVSFSGWHLLGTFSVVVRSQGINILLNVFFNPIVNAARGVAQYVYSAVTQLSNNFFVAVKPQMYKSYAMGDKEGLNTLIMRSTTMCTFLVSILVFPVLANTHYVLSLWLAEIPDYAVIFTQLVLINGIIDSSSGCTIAPALATGKIGRFQMITSIPVILNLPISYIALKMGAEPTATMIVSIVLSYITALVKVYMLKMMIGFPFWRYVVLFLRLTVVSLIIWCVIYFYCFNLANSILLLVIWSALVFCLVCISYLTMIFSKSEILAILRFVKI
jgi:O-antigen/teichoic acid export membrane protein